MIHNFFLCASNSFPFRCFWPRKTKLYDRRQDDTSLDEIERIRGAYLSLADLSDADLTGANLRAAKSRRRCFWVFGPTLFHLAYYLLQMVE
jgi:hypothetical protein